MLGLKLNHVSKSGHRCRIYSGSPVMTLDMISFFHWMTIGVCRISNWGLFHYTVWHLWFHKTQRHDIAVYCMSPAFKGRFSWNANNFRAWMSNCVSLIYVSYVLNSMAVLSFRETESHHSQLFSCPGSRQNCFDHSTPTESPDPSCNDTRTSTRLSYKFINFARVI